MNWLHGIKDTFSFRACEYILLIRDKESVFIKLSAHTSLEVLDCFPKTESQGYNLSNILKSPYYYNQPVTVVFETTTSYTYIKSYTNKSSMDLYNITSALTQKGYETHIENIEHKKNKYFVCLGVAETFLQEITQELEAAQIAVLKIIPLTLLLFTFKLKNNYVDIFFTIEGLTYYLINFDDHFIYSKVKSNSTPSQHELDKIYELYSINRQNSILQYSKKSAILTKRLINALTTNSIVKSTKFRTIHSKYAYVINTAVNVTKVLIMVFLCVALVQFCLFMFFIISADSSFDTSHYQRLYSTKLTLQEQVKDLEDRINSQAENAPTGLSIASVLSNLSQKTYHDLYLEKVLISHDKKKATIEVSGAATSERLIFRYLEDLGQYTFPYTPDLSSVNTKTITSMNKIDTVLNYTFYLEKRN